ncbi:phosphoenolpyruvate--protein phosphotransferase [Christensenella sp. MSJ-20]|uniref:phosphoenolpyruvate--protein phosphotransferase n=1 Tax=Christensenella sp. MSJ-20 TaxID=2841518 RepID=UPI001C78ABFC|nr:phosphoenolpyruvate--protein phosphotransferase [Christensenella sp. MSJ-20]
MKGIIASPGVAIAKAFVLAHPEVVIDEKLVAAQDVEKEVEKFREAVAKTEDQLNGIIAITEERLSAKEADVFRAHLMMLADPMFEEAVLDKIQNSNFNAGKAVSEATAEVAAMLASLDDEYLKERAADIKDVGGRVLDNVLGIVRTSLSDLNEPVVVFANDLTPSDTATMNLDYVKGFATDIGGRTSHTSILARIIGIPAIVGTGDITSRVNHGDLVVLDAIDCDVIVNPTEDQKKVYDGKYEAFMERKRELDKIKFMPAETLDGHHVEVVANIASPNDVKGALENGAEGCGLFRTEFLYMNRPDLPSEEEQFEAYKSVVAGMDGKPVVIRTLDIGGDKAAESIQFPPEMNPFLGWRAIRMYFDRLDIIKPQMRALLRAGVYGKLHVMFPMVISAEEIYKMKEIIEECKAELRAEGVEFDENLSIGIMVETPAAALNAHLLAEIVEFFSIGTNDLTQYVLAVDRGNEMIADLYQPLHPAVIRAMKMVIDASHGAGKWSGVCGETAGDEKGALVLLGLGLDEFSMSAGSIPAVKNMIRKANYAEVKKGIEECLTMYTTEEVNAKLDQMLKDILG